MGTLEVTIMADTTWTPYAVEMTAENAKKALVAGLRVAQTPGVLLADGQGGVRTALPGDDYGYPLLQGNGPPSAGNVANVGQHYFDLTASGPPYEYICVGYTEAGFVWRVYGDPGAGFYPKGRFLSLDALQEAIEAGLADAPSPGDAYFIGEAAPYDVYFYDGQTLSWVNLGPLGGNGSTAAGIPPHGAAGQFLIKKTAADYDAVWSDIPDNSIDAAMLKADAVTAAKLADDAVETAAIKNSNVTAAKLADECKNIIRESVALAASAFVSDTTIEGARYKAELAITGCTAAMLPIIAWTAAQSEELEVKRIESAEGKIIIYSADAPGADLTIPTVALISPIGTGSSGTGTGGSGTPGANGVTFTPHLSANGVLSWTNDGGLANPDPVNIKGVPGSKGDKGDKGDPGSDASVTAANIKSALGYTPADSKDIPTVPTALKNPNALTIKAGEAEIIYDGSTVKEINVSMEALDPVWIREQLADMAGDYTEFAPLNAGVAAYLAAAKATYTESDQTASIVANYTSQGTDDPDGLTVDAGASATLEVISLADKTSWTQPNGDKLYNLVPNRVYKWTGASSGTGKAKATDALRMIRMTGARNVRDLGGWPCDGGIVRYGRIFRGGQLSQNNVAIATAWDIAELKALGVKVELDIRATSEQDRTTSVLGDGVEFVSKPTANNAVGLLKNHPDEAVAILNAIFTAVAADKPIYFHCQAGADRTGTIAFVLLALLGVDHVSLDIDYELTSFYDSRKRNASPWPEQWTYINGFTGDSPKEKVTAWALANGITQAQIDAFRTKMIYTGYIATGSGSTTPTTYPVTLTLTNCTSSNEASSAAAGAAYTTTITASSGYTLGGITVTMGGTDISSTAVSGSTVTIANVTGAIVITAAATATPAAKTNLIPTSTDSAGAAFGTNGIKSGTRLNSSGAESTSNLSSFPSAGVTGFMPVTYGKTIEFENCNIPANSPSAAGASVCYCAFYDASYQVITSQYLSAYYSNGYLELDENNHAKTLNTAAKTSPYNLKNAKYFRVSSCDFSGSPAIYVE